MQTNVPRGQNMASPAVNRRVNNRGNGFQTGDMVSVVIEKGKYLRVQSGRAIIRQRGDSDEAGKRITTWWRRFRL